MPGCKPVSIYARLFLLSLTFTSLLYPQIPINGFCRFDSIGITSGFTGSFPLNYNGDPFTDLLCFKAGTQKAVLLKGKAGASFEKESPVSFPVPLDRITLLSDVSSNPEGYAVVSKKKKSVSFVKFSVHGSAVYKELKFKSIPNAVTAADIDNDAAKEIMISGPAFNGLVITDTRRNATKEKMLSGRESFSAAMFADINNDSYPDIVAYSPVSGRMRFYYNNSRGEFSEVNSFVMKEPVTGLGSADLNGDSFTDLFISTAAGISVWYGDGYNSFGIKQTINLNRGNKKTVHADLNSDGKTDLAVLSADGSIVSIYFQKDDGSFFPSWDLRPGTSLTDISVYYSSFIKGITALASNGVVYLLNNYLAGGGNSQFISPFYPAAISVYDFTRNGNDDIILIDTLNYKVNVFFRNNNGIPVLVSSVDIFERLTRISPIVSKGSAFAFYLWKKGGRSMTEITVDPVTFQLKQKVYYLSTTLQYVTAFNGNDGSVGFSVITGSDEQLKSEGLRLNGDFLQLVYSAPVGSLKGSPVADGKGKIFFLQQLNDSLFLTMVDPETGQQTITEKKKSSVIYSLLFNGDVLNNDNPCSVTLTEDKGNLYFSLYGSKYKRRLKIDGDFPENNISALTVLPFRESNSGLNRYFILSDDLQMYSLLPLQRKKVMFVLPYEPIPAGTSGVTILPGEGRKPYALMHTTGKPVLSYKLLEPQKRMRTKAVKAI